MPPWGRPSGGRKGKNKKEWERQQREWEQQRRFEELASDSDDGQGVDLGRRPFASDELHYSGADLGRGSNSRRDFTYSDDSEESDDGIAKDTGNGAAMQLALRDKEEVLVQRAMERIRRAQMLGKTNVKLTPSERDALERKLANDQAKSKRPVLKSKPSGERRSSGRSSSSQTAIVPTAGRRKSRSSLVSTTDREPMDQAQSMGPGFLVAGPDGRPIYAPLGYHPPSPGPPFGFPSSRPESRSGSAHSLQSTPPLAQTQFRGASKRYPPGSEQHGQSLSSTRKTSSPRPLPDDPDWQPRARSTSNLFYSPDPYQYQAYSPPLPQIPPQYAQGRRHVSGPAEIGYPALRPGVRPYAATSDPSLPRREYSGGHGPAESISDDDYDDNDDDDDDQDEGVQIDVAPYGHGYDITMSSGGPSVPRTRKVRR
ncbi:hypothetical protein MMC19_000739 [Ptychographa xylographoides]|nr:hypothetical protein [Ptychographa xylographoides]